MNHCRKFVIAGVMIFRSKKNVLYAGRTSSGINTTFLFNFQEKRIVHKVSTVQVRNRTAEPYRRKRNIPAEADIAVARLGARSM